MKAESNFEIFVAHPFKSLAPLKKINQTFQVLGSNFVSDIRYYWQHQYGPRISIFSDFEYLGELQYGPRTKQVLFQTLNILVSSISGPKICFRYQVLVSSNMGPRYFSDIELWMQTWDYDQQGVCHKKRFCIFIGEK